MDVKQIKTVSQPLAVSFLRGDGDWAVPIAGGSGADKGVMRVRIDQALPAYTYDVPSKSIQKDTNGSINSYSDGVTLITDEKVLVSFETGANEKYNGLYKVSIVGDGESPFVLIREENFDETSEILVNSYVWVSEGTLWQDTQWVLTTDAPIVLDTTALAFQEVPVGGGVPEATTAETIAETIQGKYVGPKEIGEWLTDVLLRDLVWKGSNEYQEKLLYNSWDTLGTPITGTQHDWNPTEGDNKILLKIQADAEGYDITGLVGGTEGRVMYIVNNGNYAIRLPVNDVLSLAANRWYGSHDIWLHPQDMVQFIWSGQGGWHFPKGTGQAHQQVYGNIYWTGNATVTPIVTVDVPVKAVGTEVVFDTLRNFTHADGVLTYVGREATAVYVHLSGSLECGFSAKTVGIIIGANGAALTNARVVHQADTANDPFAMSVSAIVQMSYGDTLSLYCINETDAKDVTLVEMNMTAHAIGNPT